MSFFWKQKLSNESMPSNLKTFVYDGIEHAMTGRVAIRKFELRGKIKEDILYEIKPLVGKLPTNSFGLKWVNKNSLYEVYDD